MANVRKVTHRARKDGAAKTSWRATWIGPDGKRQSKNFAKKGDADAFLKMQGAGLVGGSAAMSVTDLARAHLAWFEGLVRQGLREAATRDGYAVQLDKHLQSDPEFAKLRLAELTTPRTQQYLDDLLPRCGSIDIVKRMRRGLVTWCKFGQRKGWLLSNPAQPCKVERLARHDSEDRVEIPPKEQLAALLQAAEQGPDPERDTAIVRVLMFGGLRISELLGLADEALQISGKAGTIRVRERLDHRYLQLGRTKSKKSLRDVPIGPAAVLAVKAWRMKRGPVQAFLHKDAVGETKRVPGRLFPDPAGADLWDYYAFWRGPWLALMRRAGLTEIRPDGKGKNREVPLFGPHTLRHVAASLWIEQGLQPKRIQALLGHSTLQMTMDLYGHLWQDDDQDRALAVASESLIPAAKPGRI